MVKAQNDGLMGVIAYKAGMGTVIVRDKTDKSMTQNKKIALPVTVLEVPSFKIYSVRFYKNGIVMKDVVVSSDKFIKRLLRAPKKHAGHAELDSVKDFDDVHVIVYPVFKDGFKKTPDVAEVAVQGNDKLATVKKLVDKEIHLKDVFSWELVDARGMTKGKGFSGPVARFGISLRSHKAEKGVRRPGSLGPWHPARVTFKAPMAGQLGMFNRVTYNLKVIGHGAANEASYIQTKGFKNYGPIRSNYVIVAGSVQGPAKRQLLLTPSLRPNKKQSKKKYEFVEAHL
jgi:large subunit ribosomal protein L3